MFFIFGTGANSYWKCIMESVILNKNVSFLPKWILKILTIIYFCRSELPENHMLYFVIFIMLKIVKISFITGYMHIAVSSNLDFWNKSARKATHIKLFFFFFSSFFLLNPLINYQIASPYSFLQLNQQSSRVLLIYWSEVFCSWPCDSSIPPLDRIVPINYP